MAVIKKLEILSFAKLQSVMGALIGLVLGIIYAFGGLVIDLLVSTNTFSASAWSTPGLSLGTVLAFGALIGMPLIFACFGFVLGIVEALLYNLYSKWFKGVQ